MPGKFSISTAGRAQLFCMELVKWGIDYGRAIKVAHILAVANLEEPLGLLEAQLVEDVCREWLEKRKGWEATKRIVMEAVEVERYPFISRQGVECQIR